MRFTQGCSIGTRTGVISATVLSLTVTPAAHEPQEQPHRQMKAASACTSISSVRLPDVTITEAVPALPGGVIPAVAAPRHRQPVKIEVAHCRVSGVIGKQIGFAVWLPDAWNGRFFMGGGGAFVGSIQNQASLSLNLGYATAGTDTGHTSSDIFDPTWALNNLEGQLNFGHLSIHRTATVAKAIVRAYYGADPAYSYFLGCSNGGRQALMEAQRYPEDFDGIVAGSPVASFTQFAATCLKNAQATFPNPSALSASAVTPENLTLLQAATLARCDVLDGVKDGVLDDPRACAFRLADLPACPEDRLGRECLTRAQRATIERIYAPASQQNLPGRPFGGEDDPSGQGWKQWIGGGSAPSLQWRVGVEFFRYFVFDDPSWDYSRYALSGWERDTERIAPFLDATSTDLSAFKARNGKLIIWHGWSDPAITALASVDNYTQVESKDPAVRSYFRLFMLPGVLHCGGGAGPTVVDWFGAIADWVERGLAPERLIAAKVDDNGKTIRTRPVCPYPQRAVYTGQGSTDDAGNFVCRAP